MRIEHLQEHLQRADVHISRRDLIRYTTAGSVTMMAGLPVLTLRASAQGAGAEPTPGGIWRMALQGNPTAYPITAPGALVDILVNKVIYNNLTQYRLDEAGDAIEVVPDLAESWESNADLTQFTFRLKQGILWHDGAPLTSADVKFTFDTILNPDVNAAQRGVISSIDSIETSDDYTVVFNLKYPFAPLPVMLGYNQAIVPKHLLESQDPNQPAEFLAAPVGSGPFKFKQLIQGSHLEVEANPDYFEGRPLLDGIFFVIIPDGNARVAQVRSGDVDFTVVDASQVETLQSDPNIMIRQVPQVNYYFFAINHTVPRLQDVRVRQALIMAINRQAIVDTVLKGYAQVAHGPTHPFLGDYYNPDVRHYDYDPEGAQALLADAGWTKNDDGKLVNAAGETFTIRFNGPQGYPAMEQVLIYAQQEYQNLGMDVTLEIPEWSVHLEQYHALDYDLLMNWWVTPPDPDLYDHYHTESNSNWWAYSNPELDELLIQARSTADHAQRVGLYHQIQSALAEDVPVVYLYHQDEIQALSKRTQGFAEMGYRDALTWSELIWVQE